MMLVEYNTEDVTAAERYEYYRQNATCEVAPVSIHGSTPGHLHAKMSGINLDGMWLHEQIFAADGPVEGRRTPLLIRSGDPEYYRVSLTVHGATQVWHESRWAAFRAGDLGLFNTSRPYLARMPSDGRREFRIVMLTVPRSQLPIKPDLVRPHLGTLLARRISDRALMAQFLIDLVDEARAAGAMRISAPGGPIPVTDVLHDCLDQVLRGWGGLPGGITPQTHQLLRILRVQAALRSHLHDPALKPDHLARLMHVSTRWLHQAFSGVDLSPMRLLRQLRLELCRQDLLDPTQTGRSIQDIWSARGFSNFASFCRVFKHAYGMTPGETRQLR